MWSGWRSNGGNYTRWQYTVRSRGAGGRGQEMENEKGGGLRRRAGRHRQKWTGKSNSTSFHFQRARSLARSLIRFVRFVRFTLALIRRFMQPMVSSSRTKIGNAAVFAKRSGSSVLRERVQRRALTTEIPSMTVRQGGDVVSWLLDPMMLRKYEQYEQKMSEDEFVIMRELLRQHSSQEQMARQLITSVMSSETMRGSIWQKMALISRSTSQMNTRHILRFVSFCIRESFLNTDFLVIKGC